MALRELPAYPNGGIKNPADDLPESRRDDHRVCDGFRWPIHQDQSNDIALNKKGGTDSRHSKQYFFCRLGMRV